jgi:hypothetical protein
MYQQSLGYPTSDPNVNRAIEETVAIVSDIDQRVQALKIGICQALPSLAPAFFAKDPYTGQLVNRNLALGTTMVPQFGAPTFASPYSAISPLSTLPTAFGVNPLAASAIGINPFAAASFGVSPFASGIGAVSPAHLGTPLAGAPWAGVTNPFIGSSFRTF